MSVNIHYFILDVKKTILILSLAGIDNRKFYSEGNDATVVAALASLSDDAGFAVREEVFSKSRPTMQKEFRFAI